MRRLELTDSKEKKWSALEDKALDRLLAFMATETEADDSVRVAVQMIKENIKLRQNILHEKVLELTIKRVLGSQDEKKALPPEEVAA